jgi:hypothetical protein
MNEGANPMGWLRGMSLTGHVLCEKHIARAEDSLRAIAQSYFDAAGKSKAPLAARRVVPSVKIIPERIVFEYQRGGGNGCQKILRPRLLIQIFKVGLAIFSSIESTKLH